MSAPPTLNMAKGISYENHVVNTLRPEYDNIWLWQDVPESILIENKIITNYTTYSEHRRDIGVDILAVKDNTYTYIQCKNYEGNVCVNDIAGFIFFMLMNKVSGMLCYSNGLSKFLNDVINDKQDVPFKITPRHIPYDNAKIVRPNNDMIHVARNYQLEAVKLFSNNNYQSCILAMPCGTGKTYTISMLAKQFDNIIVLSPLKKLTYDTLENMNTFLENNYTKILISSDGNRNPNAIRNILDINNLIGCTYDSVDVLIQLIDNLENILIVIDEYHNLSQNNLNNPEDNMYRLLNRCDKKVYLSATPNMSIKYDVIYRYEWEKAINNKYICDFNIVIPIPEVVDDDNLNKMIKLLQNVRDVNEKMIQKGYFIIKSLLFNGNKKCIVYLTTIEKANAFNNVIKGLLNLLNIQCEIYIITNRTSKANRANRDNYIFRFRNNDVLTILLNVHILDEGVDIPECDSVFITQPNNNIDNLIQRMCRCNRWIYTKTKCNMYIWTTEQKAQKVLEYIKNNTYNGIFDKIQQYSAVTNNVVLVKKRNVNSRKIVKDDNSLDSTDHIANNDSEYDPDEYIIDNCESSDNNDNVSVVNNSRFVCNTCGKVFKRNENLKYHIEKSACKERSYECKFCSKLFTERGNMYRHMKHDCNAKKQKDNAYEETLKRMAKIDEKIEKIDEDQKKQKKLQTIWESTIKGKSRTARVKKSIINNNK